MRVEERWEGCREQDVLENSPRQWSKSTEHCKRINREIKKGRKTHSVHRVKLKNRITLGKPTGRNKFVFLLPHL